jgi:hypothetical protein
VVQFFTLVFLKMNSTEIIKLHIYCDCLINIQDVQSVLQDFIPEKYDMNRCSVLNGYITTYI